MIKKNSSLCILLFLMPIFFSCNSHENNGSGGPPFGEPGGGRPPIKEFPVLSLSARKANVNLDFPATIQGQQVIEVRPKIDGYVDAIYVKEGANVKKGQLLFRISNPSYEQEEITANANIKSAVADVHAAQMSVAKIKPLVEKDIVSKYQLEAAEYTLQAKEAALAQAQATLANAKTNIGYTIIRSPQDGVIGNIPYKIGSLVNSTTANPLTSLSNIGNVYAYYSLNEKQLLQLFVNTPGSSMQEKLESFPPAVLILADNTEYPIKGRIETASGLISTETGTASFKASFPNPMGIIRSGASATVRIPRTIDSSLIIPQAATYELQDKLFVFKLIEKNKIQSTAIKTIPMDNGRFFIVSSGLKPGDKIVAGGLIGLKDNMEIIPKEINADSLYSKAQ